MSIERRRALIEPGHGQLSIVRQCELVSISRSSFYHRPVDDTAETLGLMRLIDAQFLETPWYGSRQMSRHLRRDGHEVGRKRVRRLMTRMGLAPIYQRPRTTVPHPRAPDLSLPAAGPGGEPSEPGLVCGYHVYPNAAGLSVSGRGDGLVDAQGAGLAGVQYDGRGVLRRGAAGGVWPGSAVRRSSTPIKDSQFTSADFTDVLRGAQVRISMDGRGRWMDNVFIERLWRSLKYECVYLHAFETGSELRAG